MIELNDIQVTFNPGTILENRALKSVSLEVPEHQFLTVIGSNGAGEINSTRSRDGGNANDWRKGDH